MKSDQRRVISLLVDNQSGVLARVSNLFCRRGFNIDSLTVSATNDPAVSRITVTITSDEKALTYCHELVLERKKLLKEYAEAYGPLIIDITDQTGESIWKWMEQPFPWEKEGACR